MATSEGIPSSIDIEFLELNDNPYIKQLIRLKRKQHKTTKHNNVVLVAFMLLLLCNLYISLTIQSPMVR